MKRSLVDMRFLFVDCQATGASPGNGYLLEIGWMQSDRRSRGEPGRKGCQAFFVQPPADAVIPDRVTRVTGISDSDVADGLPRSRIWRKLLAVARGVARRNRMKRCPTLIHFARFEVPFLEGLHMDHAPDQAFPLDIVCTHEIARRLYPELPRRGIKALAGFFGYRSGEKRRSCDHVQATACIWENLRAVLARDHGVTTYEDLKTWLERTPVRKFSSRGYPMKDRYRRHLPDAPGVYRMCRSGKDVLYIGKARSLKKRVNSYFKKRGHLADHILEMLTQARRIEIIETGSVLEAALLESDLIKQHSPPYNIALRARERMVVYSDTANLEFVSEPSLRHVVGPLASQDPVCRLALLRPIVNAAGSRANKAILQEMLLPSLPWDQEIEEVAKGVELLIARHLDVVSQEPAGYALQRLGQRLWLVRGDTGDVDVDTDETEGAPDLVPVRSPESIARALENVIMRAMHAIRRARLCVLLAESSVAWEERRGGQPVYRYLVLEHGAVVKQGGLPRRKRPAVPPGYRKRFLERQRAFDVATLDRLRVLITELRHLVNTGSWVRVRLRPNAILDNEKLERIFTWV